MAAHHCHTLSRQHDERAPPAGKNARQGAPRKYMKVAVEAFTKVAALKHFEEHGDIRATIRHFYGALPPLRQESKRTQIYKWRKEQVALSDALNSGKGGLKKQCPKGLGTSLSKEAELDLVVWVNDLRGEGIPISTLMFKLRASDITVEYGQRVFAASWSWRKTFRQRHKLSLRARTRQGQIAPAEFQQIAADFAAKIDKMVHDRAFFEYLPKKMVNAKGAKTVWVRCGGKEKERATVMLLGDADGVKYAPFVIFKAGKSKNDETDEANKALRHGFGRRLWREIEAAQQSTGLHIYGSPKGWWNGELSRIFLETFFGHRTEKSPPVLLLWDEFAAHWVEDVVDYAKTVNVVLERVPPHATGVCQPADVAWIKPFKDRLRNEWVARLSDQVRDRSSGVSCTPPGQPVIARWVRDAWDGIDSQIITNGFRKCSVLLDPVECVASNHIENLESLNLLDDEGGVVDSDDDIECETSEPVDEPANSIC